MKKYLLFIAFMLSGVCFSQDMSIEEQLKLLGADDFFVSDVKPPPDTDGAETKDGESLEQADSLTADGNANAQSDSAAAAPTVSGRNRQPMSSVSSITPVGAGQGRPAGDADALPKISVFDTASVADERTIDFSRNLSQYRSPQKALLYSLLLPGLGQAYNKNYWRTGLYAAIEIGMITGAIYFKRDADKITKRAKTFADDRFDTTQLRDFYDNLTKKGLDKFGEEIIISDGSEEGIRATVGDFIFGLGGIYSDIYDTVTNVIKKYAYQEYMDQFSEDFYGNIRDNYGT